MELMGILVKKKKIFSKKKKKKGKNKTTIQMVAGNLGFFFFLTVLLTMPSRPGLYRSASDSLPTFEESRKISDLQRASRDLLELADSKKYDGKVIFFFFACK